MKDEELPDFVSRFFSLAAVHLISSNSSPTSKIDQVLAITLIKNEKMDESTLNNGKLLIINLVESSSKEEKIQDRIKEKKSKLDELQDLMDKKPQRDMYGIATQKRMQPKNTDGK